MILGLVQEGQDAGARLSRVCHQLGIDIRTIQRWKAQGIGDDARAGPRSQPTNKLTQAERARILEVANSPEHRNLSPKQIVPALADKDIYVASEASFYRVLRDENQMAHRGLTKPPANRHRPKELVATGPNQVWSWDITYLKAPVRGLFFYLYMAVDVWSRKIVGWGVHAAESADHAKELVIAACRAEGVEPGELSLHADNGAPMRAATLLATLQGLGVASSFSRPGVSNDNPFSEALFRTTKYRPDYPPNGFNSLDEAREWVACFVHWYNTLHRHSAIRFVTPEERHSRRENDILARRHTLYERARQRRPDRWSRDTRNWTPVKEVRLNPAPPQAASEVA